MPDLKLYTIADLRAWLIDNNPPAGLNEQVIAPVRAWAILNNPYVKDDDAVVAAIYEGDDLAAFTAAFPDMISESESVHHTPYTIHRIWWATTLWCNPKYQGKGYGLIVIGSLIESHEGELTLDRWGAQETVEIFTCLGYKTIYTPRYILGDKSINRSTLKGKLAYCIQEISKSLHSTHYALRSTHYTLKYSTFIDGEAYAFMQAHQGNNLFLREQQMLNWILTYPFIQGCTLIDRIEKDTIFSANVQSYQYQVVKVYVQNELFGIYLLRNNSGVLSVVAIYYQEENQDVVFASIAEYLLKLRVEQIQTEDESLMKYLKQVIYFPSVVTNSISFSYPEAFYSTHYALHSTHFTLQLIDGDSFA